MALGGSHEALYMLVIQMPEDSATVNRTETGICSKKVNNKEVPMSSFTPEHT